MMVTRRGIASIVVVVLLVSLGLYTLVSMSSEPHPESPSVVTSREFAAEVANGTIMSDPASLIFHTFALAGSNAMFGFSWIIGSETYENFGPNDVGGNPMGLFITEVSHSIGFPYFGKFLLQPITCNVSITFNNATYYSIQGYPDDFGPSPDQNSSVSEYGYLYFPPISFTTEPNNPYSNSSYASTNFYIPYVSSYNLTYNIEIRPIVEYGPYYVIGNPVWISHTFEYPYI